jgi:hypothetical protein
VRYFATFLANLRSVENCWTDIESEKLAAFEAAFRLSAYTGRAVGLDSLVSNISY